MIPHRADAHAMLSDPTYLEFVVALDRQLRSDPAYASRKQAQILAGAARGERIVPFEGRYVVSSFFPPMPSRAFQTFLEGAADRETMYSDLAHGRRSAPLSTHLCITSRCQYNCEHCGATTPDRQSELSREQWVQVIRDLQDLGVAYIAFSGGEPLLRQDMEEIVAAVDDRSVTLMFTNGRALSSQRAVALKTAGLFYLAVSLDSPDAEEHNRFRRNPRAFTHAVTALENAAAAGLYTMISSVVIKRHLNREYLLRLLELGQRHGACEVRFHQAVPSGQLLDPADADQIFYTEADKQMIHDLQFEVNASRPDLPKMSSFTYTEGPDKFGCGAGVIHSYVSATGEFWPCDFAPISFGNVLREPVRAIYARMAAAAAGPRRFCLARKISPQLHGKSLPLAPEEACRLCLEFRDSTYPRFYNDLQAA